MSKTLHIGSVDVGCGVFLAPMAGYSDHSFRTLCKEQGADVVVTELISAKALHFENEKTYRYLASGADEAPAFVQLFGNEPELMAEVAARLQTRFAGIDVNLGCPAPKVFRNHEGSALLAEPDLIYRIVKAMSSAVTCPVTVKIRKGIHKGDNLSVEAALAAQEGGAKAVTLHARTAAQMFSGPADWENIREVKEKLSIPLIGNGDVKSAQDALHMLAETGCDGIMVGQAARGNPWIFREIRAAFKGEPIPDRPTRQEVAEMMRRHVRLVAEEKGDTVAALEMRAQIPFYAHAFRGGSELRRRIQHLRTTAEFLEAIDAFEAFDNLPKLHYNQST